MSIRQLIHSGACCLIFAFSVSVLAQERTASIQVEVPDKPLVLHQVLQFARNNIDVQVARLAVTGAQGDLLGADRSPFPTLSLRTSQIDLQNGNGPGSLLTEKTIDKSIGIDWTWERGNKRGIRAELAQRTIAAVQADLEETQVAQALAAASAFHDVAAAQEKLNLVADIERSAAQLATTALQRVRVGDLSAQDAARLEIEASRARGDVLIARMDLRRSAIVLAQMLGLSWKPVASNEAGVILKVEPQWPPSDVRQPPFTPTELLVARRPDVRAAQERVQVAQKGVDAASALKKADITWGVSYDHFPGTSTGLIELRMQMPIQTGPSRGYDFQGEALRAQSNLAQAQANLEKIQLAAWSEMQRIAQEVDTAENRWLGYNRDVLPRASQVAQNAELAYRLGAQSLGDLLDARRTLRATQLEALTARVDYAKAQGALQLRSGGSALQP